MDGDEGHVENNMLPVDMQREVVLIDGIFQAAFGSIAPIRALEMNQIGVEKFSVELIENVIGRFEGYFIFTGIPAGNDSHIIHNTLIYI